jgi:hypothetical protein
MLAQGRNETIEKWLASLPDEIQGHDPHLLHIAGLCRLPFNMKESRALLEKSFRLLNRRNDHVAAMQVCGCIMEAVIIEGDAYEDLDPYINWLDEMLQKRPELLEKAAESIAGTVLFALAYRNMNHRTLPFWVEKAEAGMLKTVDAPSTLKLCNYLMAYYLFRGEFTKISRIMLTLEPLKKKAEAVPVLHILCILLEAYYAVYARASSDEGIALAKKGLELAREADINAYNFWLSYLIIAASVPAGDIETAAGYLEELSASGQGAPIVRAADIHSLSGAVAMGRGDWSGAAEHFRLAVDTFQRAGAPFSAAIYRRFLAHALFELATNEVPAGASCRPAKRSGRIP